MNKNSFVSEHVLGTFVNVVNENRINDMNTSLTAQDAAFSLAQEQIRKVRDFIGDPSSILGSEKTKHGEIAEQVEIGIRNARAALDGTLANDLPGDITSISRTGPADYLINNIEVQSKFINGDNNNLAHVLQHMNKYQNFGKDGSYYHIPKDSHELINKVISGQHVDGLSKKTINAIMNKVNEIESITGQPFNDVVQPGISNYADVQQGTINNTINGHENDLSKENEIIKNNIESDYVPSLAEMGKVSLTGAAVGGGLVFTSKVYSKYKDGKNIFAGDFDIQDWKELGIDSAKGAGVGAVSSAVIYGLTNYASMAAPFASAVVSASKGVSELTKQYASKNINLEEYVDLGLVVCTESAMVGLFTAVGQTLIPLPVIGAVIGSIAGRMFIELTGSNNALKEEMTFKINTLTKKLDKAQSDELARVNAEYSKLGELTKAAFNPENNTFEMMQTSIILAQVYEVPDNEVIKSLDELDAFMLG